MLKFKMLKMDFFFSMDSFSSEIQYFLVAFLRKLTPFLSIFFVLCYVVFLLFKWSAAGANKKDIREPLNNCTRMPYYIIT